MMLRELKVFPKVTTGEKSEVKIKFRGKTGMGGRGVPKHVMF